MDPHGLLCWHRQVVESPLPVDLSATAQRAGSGGDPWPASEASRAMTQSATLPLTAASAAIPAWSPFPPLLPPPAVYGKKVNRHMEICPAAHLNNLPAGDVCLGGCAVIDVFTFGNTPSDLAGVSQVPKIPRAYRDPYEGHSLDLKKLSRKQMSKDQLCQNKFCRLKRYWVVSSLRTLMACQFLMCLLWFPTRSATGSVLLDPEALELHEDREYEANDGYFSCAISWASHGHLHSLCSYFDVTGTTSRKSGTCL